MHGYEWAIGISDDRLERLVVIGIGHLAYASIATLGIADDKVECDMLIDSAEERTLGIFVSIALIVEVFVMLDEVIGTAREFNGEHDDSLSVVD